MKCNWEEDGLIRRAPDGGKWLTTEALWLHVIKRAGDDEVVGARAQGQQVLDVPSQSGSSCVLAPKTRSPDRAVQATLTGDTVDHRQSLNWCGVRENQMKDPTRATTKAEKAATKTGQVTLSLATDYDLDAWDVNVPWFRENAVVAPTGQVY
ncbi:hypothetical protein [Halorussus pelagicus]|uniref:hypothetical protein n=1 Tax=Halorussus pelagicus TaxID=2505977 RepID=UPI000FFC91F0|nr:hypothetical protein [Halorussus pelagicus]